MVYMGSKNRIAKELIPIITKDLKPNQWYCEPFVGGANMIDKIEHPYKLGADNNKYLIALLEAVQNGQELPEHITKDEYIAVKTNKDNYPDWYVGFVGFVCSFRGIFFCSYVSDVIFKCSSYDALDIPANSIIYCDPPYNGTTKYKDNFDSDAFWQWCRDKAKEGHTVYVSEYNAPEDFKCIWEKQINSNLGGTSKTATEKLFTI